MWELTDIKFNLWINIVPHWESYPINHVKVVAFVFSRQKLLGKTRWEQDDEEFANYILINIKFKSSCQEMIDWSGSVLSFRVE